MNLQKTLLMTLFLLGTMMNLFAQNETAVTVYEYDKLEEIPNAIIEMDFPEQNAAGAVGEFKFIESYINDYSSYPNAYTPIDFDDPNKVFYVIDSKSDIYQVVQVDGQFPAFQFQLDPLAGTTLPPNGGTGLIMQPTENLKLLLLSTNLPEKLRVHIVNHDLIVLDKTIKRVDSLAKVNQVITRNGDDITLNLGGGTVSVRDGDFNSLNEIQDLNQLRVNNDITVTPTLGGTGFTFSVEDDDSDSQNELQDLGASFSNGVLTLNISDGSGTGDIDLSSINTDDQNITATISGRVITLVMENGNTETVTLPAEIAQQLNSSKVGSIYTVTLDDGGQILIDVSDDDSDPLNEIQDVTGSTGINVVRTGDDFDIENTAPDQIVGVTGSGSATITGLYPNFNVDVPVPAANLDNDPVNEIQDPTLDGDNLSLTGSSVDINLSQYADNTDMQDLGLGDKTGTVQEVTIDNGSSVLLDVADNDNDPLNEVETVSAGSNINVVKVGSDYQVSNSAPDVPVVVTGTNDATISGSYPNFNVDVQVPANLDNDPNNEDQTVVAGSNMVVTQNGDEFTVINDAPDVPVSISGLNDLTVTGSYPNFTLDVQIPAETPNLDNDSGNEIQSLSSSKVGVTEITVTPSLGGLPTTFNIEDADADNTNELQDVTYDPASREISLTGSDVEVILPADTDNQGVDQFGLVDNNLTLEIQEDGQTPHIVSLSKYDKDLTLSNNVLSLTDSDVDYDLSYLLDNTDEQGFDLSTFDPVTKIATLSLDNSTVDATLDLSSLEIETPKDTTLRFTSNTGGVVSVDVNGLPSLFSGVTMVWSSNIPKVTIPVNLSYRGTKVKGVLGDLGGQIDLKLQIEDLNNTDNSGYDASMHIGTTALYKKAVVSGQETWISDKDAPPSSQVQFNIITGGSVPVYQLTWKNLDNFGTGYLCSYVSGK